MKLIVALAIVDLAFSAIRIPLIRLDVDYPASSLQRQKHDKIRLMGKKFQKTLANQLN
jgi:hypothetical protein